MSLATRCSSCGTVFRVVQDQLRMSAGWVRCGRCGAVFNAIEGLVDVVSDAAMPGSPAAPPVAPGAPAAPTDELVAQRAGEPPGGTGADQAGKPEGAWSRAGALAEREAADLRHAAVAPSDGAGGGAPGDAVHDAAAEAPGAASDEVAGGAASDDMTGLASGDAIVAPPGESPAPVAAAPSAAAAAQDAVLRPSFVRSAERAARWRRPGIRATLALGALAAAAGLAAQVTLTYHDRIAARWPAAAPWVARLCGWAGCTVEPPRHIDALVVLSSSLVRDGSPGQYRLGVTLRNRYGSAVRLPAFELSLTDAQGRLLVRRVLQPDELGARQGHLDAGAELVLETTLLAGGEPIVGYTIEAFYP